MRDRLRRSMLLVALIGVVVGVVTLIWSTQPLFADGHHHGRVLDHHRGPGQHHMHQMTGMMDHEATVQQCVAMMSAPEHESMTEQCTAMIDSGQQQAMMSECSAMMPMTESMDSMMGSDTARMTNPNGQAMQQMMAGMMGRRSP